MYDRTQLREIIAGRKNGLGPALLRMIASCGEPFYYAGSAWRNRSYDRNPAKAIRVEVPVISIGNITAGGTGKTPMVEWIARALLDQGKQPGIISRGYGAKEGAANDEALELAQKLPGVPHVQNPDRVAAAKVAIEQHSCDCLLLDDAFQHRRIGRDLDLVLIDATAPFGYGHLLPRGLLRESLTGLRRADAVVFTRADAISAEEREQIWETVTKFVSGLPVIEALHAPSTLLTCDGQRESLDRLRGARIAAFSGIGNPAAFRSTLEQCSAKIVDFRTFPDHHHFSDEDLASLSTWIEQLPDVDLAVCTHKDLVKVDLADFGGKPLFALAIGMKFLCGEQELSERIINVI